MTLKNNKTIVTFEADEVLISRQTNHITIKIEPNSSYEFVITKVIRLVTMDDDMFKEMCRIAKY